MFFFPFHMFPSTYMAHYKFRYSYISFLSFFFSHTHAAYLMTQIQSHFHKPINNQNLFLPESHMASMQIFSPSRI